MIIVAVVAIAAIAVLSFSARNSKTINTMQEMDDRTGDIVGQATGNPNYYGRVGEIVCCLCKEGNNYVGTGQHKIKPGYVFSLGGV